MSWDERGCFGSAQYAHKYIKCPRERAKSRPPSIYRRTPSNRVVSKFRGRQTRLSLTRQTSCPRPSPLRVSRVHGVFKFQRSIPIDRRVCRSCTRASVAPSNAVQKGPATDFNLMDAAVTMPSDAVQCLLLLCTEAVPAN
jgi:hypothetical protein